jgi:flagellar protein FlaG
MKIDSSIATKPVDLNPIMEKNKTAGIQKDNTKPIPREELTAPSIDETTSSVEKANKILFKNNTHLKFEVNDESEKVIVRIIDDETGKVLKEIPDEDFVEMMHKLCEIAGIIIDERC